MERKKNRLRSIGGKCHSKDKFNLALYQVQLPVLGIQVARHLVSLFVMEKTDKLAKAISRP